jgi:ABC-2 type transport system ATP-binding protein
MARLNERFGLDPTMSEGAVTFHVGQGEEFILRLFAELGVAIRSVSVARPTLDDVFMTCTIRDAEASAGDRLRTSPFVRARRGR